jgi:hypothetical protein
VRFLQEQAEERDWSPGSVDRWQAALPLIFRVGMDNGKISLNPGAKIKRKTENRGRVRFYPRRKSKYCVRKLRRAIPNTFPLLKSAFTPEYAQESNFGSGGPISTLTGAS